jgi:uncharacterized protein YqeY
VSVRNQINEDLKTAMKSGDKGRRDILRLMSAAFKQTEVDSRQELTEDDVIRVLKKEVKQREETIADLEKAGREADDVKAELAVITAYLPQQLDRAAIVSMVKEAIVESGATTVKDMGNVMRVLMPKLKGQADGKLVNDIVRELLD